MYKNISFYKQEVLDDLLKNSYEFRQMSNDLSDSALRNARERLHPLLHRVDLEKLGHRHDFLEAFKCSLEREIAQKIVLWLPCVKAVYRFDSSRRSITEEWDNTIHLLVLVPRLMPPIKELGPLLDGEILNGLKHLGWSRFQDSKSIIEIQQVTPEEMRHGVCYGAMFSSVYTAPSQIWPLI